MNAVRTSIVIWVLLLMLMAASVTAVALAPGPAAQVFSLACAVAMAGLIFIWFMGLYSADGLLRVFALAAVFWLALMVGLTLSDYVTRGGVGG